MSKQVILKAGAIAICGLSLMGCATLDGGVEPQAKTQVQLRSIQSRAFDITNKNKMLRATIATMQDLGFVLDKADETLGMVTGTKMAYNRKVMLTVSIRPHGKTQLLVRANAQAGLHALEDPETYQDFFSALSRGLYLEAHEI